MTRTDDAGMITAPAPIGGAQLRKLHEQFVDDPLGTDLSALRPVIARSWSRSLKWSVSPGRRHFAEYREPRIDEQMLQCAEPVLDELERMCADTGATIYLADQDGTISAVRGQPDHRDPHTAAEPGSAMSEDVAGTNSDGTALEEGRPVQVWGAEHFCEGMQNNYCTSVPVFDPLRRSVRAVLSLSVPERVARDLDARSMALIAQGAATELTQRLTARLAVREQRLLASYLAEMRKRGSDSVVVMDDRTTIVSKGALHFLSQDDYAVLAGYARQSERLDRPFESEVRLGPGAIFELQARPITTDGETIGSVIRLRPPKQTPKRPHISSKRRSDPFDTLIGESLAIRRVLEVASTVVRRRMPAYIVGESGTGKSLLAMAMAERLAADAVGFDCAEAGFASAKAADQLRVHLDGGAAVVLRHTDRLQPDSIRLLSETLGRYENPPVILTMANLRDDALELTNALVGVEIDMPPLRSRRDDIPLLVAHFLSSGDHGVTRVSPGLMRALVEADWTQNVAQLREFVETAAARCTFSELSAQHLSDAQQRTLARNPLSRLEEAELHQIREALVDAGGNRVRAAELLQIGRSTLYRKIENYTRRGFTMEV